MPLSKHCTDFVIVQYLLIKLTICLRVSQSKFTRAQIIERFFVVVVVVFAIELIHFC